MMNEGRTVNVINIDFAKAFNFVNHNFFGENELHWSW